MNTEIINIANSSDDIYKNLKKMYKEGKLIAIPTETVYGLSADAKNDEAVYNIFKAKGRPSDNPLIVHFYSIEQLDNLVYYDNEKIKLLMSNFWPGALTLILKAKKDNGISKKVTAGLDTLAVRMPSNKVARNILKYTEVLLAAPSANTSGKPSPTKFSHVYHDLNGKIDAIIESEQATIGLESTVIDCTSYPFIIARPGSITKEQVEKVLGDGSIKYNDEILSEQATPIAPGMKYRHYSPDASLIVYDKDFSSLVKFLGNKNKKYGLLTFESKKLEVKDLQVNVKYLAKDEKDIEQAGRNLYNVLREFDSDKVEEIYMLPIEENKENVALLNRLNKAISKK